MVERGLRLAGLVQQAPEERQDVDAQLFLFDREVVIRARFVTQRLTVESLIIHSYPQPTDTGPACYPRRLRGAGSPLFTRLPDRNV